jgi:Ca2+-binding EF-hand superfamily protein
MSESTPLTNTQLAEFERAMAQFYSDYDNHALDPLFALFDRDGNGRISRQELFTTMNSIATEEVSQ